MSLHRTLPLVLVLLAPALPASALVNPQLQMIDLVPGYRHILVGRVEKIDLDAGQAVVKIDRALKGRAPDKPIRIVAAKEEIADDLVAWREGQVVCALVSMTRRRHEDELVFYTGTRVPWQAGRRVEPGVWRWEGDVAPEGEGLWGTWNGRTDRLVELIADLIDDRGHFPAVSFSEFAEPATLYRDELGALRGLAAIDLNGDGLADIVAASRRGVRVFFQKSDGSGFDDVTEAVGLEGVEAANVSSASIRGDGRIDLLLDGQVFLRTEAGWKRSDRVPTGNGPIVSAGFIEYDGDGYPDVLLSRRQGGLALYRNPGARGGAFIDVTRTAGLAAARCRPDGTGYVAAGDWDLDGDTDLFYATNPGLLLIQDTDGRFNPAHLPRKYDFPLSAKGEVSTGACTFAPLWRADRFDLLVATQSGVSVLTRADDGTIQEVTSDGNELPDAIFRLLGGLAADWNADGTVDVFAVTASLDQSNAFLMNRGYGSWMRVEKYRPDVLPGVIGQVGAWGGAIADFDADGDEDLVLAGADGALRLIRNGSLESRPMQAPRHATQLERYLADTRAIRVRLDGAVGRVGAQVVIEDTAGRRLARRAIGGNLFTGCRSESGLSVIVPSPGEYRVQVRWADGQRSAVKVDCPADRRLSVVTIARPDAAQPGDKQ
jgi:hypothetical protein